MNAYIYDYLRTVRGKGNIKKGALSTLTPTYLASYLLNEMIEKNGMDTSHVEDLITGCVSQVLDQASNISKSIALDSNLGEHVSGYTLNRYCGSGLEAINQAAAYAASGFVKGALIAGGVESMSRVKMGADGGGMFFDPAVAPKIGAVGQGVSADFMAVKYGFSREDLDSFAVESNKKAGIAEQEGRFKSRISIRDYSDVLVLDRDENIRTDSTLESMRSLNPSFEMMGQLGGMDSVILQRYPEIMPYEMDHRHHPGNSSAIVDGAAFMVIGNEDVGEKIGLKPKARIVSSAVVSGEPSIMLTQPANASRKALKNAGMELGDIDLIEINEAFASVVLRFIQDLQPDESIVNVNGGAIAMGHPLGATGAMILGTALDELERTDKNTALVTLCIGGGMGIATVIERV